MDDDTREDRRLHRAMAVLLTVTMLVNFASRLGSYDLWWHLKAGGEIVHSLRVPQADPYSFTAAGKPWVYQSWLGGVVLYLAHEVGGYAGLVILLAVVMTSALLLMWWAARRKGVEPALASVLCLAAAFQLKWRALARPFIFSMVLFALFYLVLQACAAAKAPGRVPRRRKSRFPREDWYLWGGGGRLALLPPLTILWANLHGAVIIAFLMLAAFGAAEAMSIWMRRGRGPLVAALLSAPIGARFRALLVTGAACLAASVITPYGPGVLTYAFWLMATVKSVRLVQEWQPAPWAIGYTVFWSVLAASIVVFALSARRRRRRGERFVEAQVWADVFLMLGFGLMAIQSARNMEWPMLLAAPVLGYHITAARAGGAPQGGQAAPDRRGRQRLYAMVACVLAAVLVLRQLVIERAAGFGINERHIPVRACDFLQKAQLPCRLFNVYEWGGYLIWRLWPAQRVFIDGRCDVYGDAVMQETMAVAAGDPGWERVLDKYDVGAILIAYRHRDSKHFFADGRWRCIYWDDAAVVAVTDRVLRSRPETGVELDLSNPVMFEERLAGAPPAAVLEQIDGVLRTNPRCWTAWSQKARCLLKAAGESPSEGGGMVQDALQAASKAVKLAPREPDAWRSLAMCREAMGDTQAAARAMKKAARWDSK